MFYASKTDNCYRFGDVIRGFVLASPNIDDPNKIRNFGVDIEIPDFAAILTPCCSIGNKLISLTPLIQVWSSFYNNEYFCEDLTRINREMDPKQSVSRRVWDTLPNEEKEKRLKVGKCYAFLEFFIYESNNYFPSYVVSRQDVEDISTNYYMIDFRNIIKVSCNKVISPKESPIELKCLQLSVRTRSELREKIAYYYGRTPKEDQILES